MLQWAKSYSWWGFNILELHVFCDLHLCELVSFLLALMRVCFVAFVYWHKSPTIFFK
jgi:hypothetical protein